MTANTRSSSRKPKRSKQIKFTPKPLSTKERWGEVIVSHTEPTKPDAVMAKRVVIKPRKRRKEIAQAGQILDSVKSWEQLSDKTKQRLQGAATQAIASNKAHIK